MTSPFECVNHFIIEVVDLVWKGLRPMPPITTAAVAMVLKSLTWFGRDCDNQLIVADGDERVIEVVDLVWKGLRHQENKSLSAHEFSIEVVDLVWKGLRPFAHPSQGRFFAD